MDARSSVFALLVCALGVLAALVVFPLVEYVLAACLLAVVLRPTYERLLPHVGPRAAGVALTVLAVVGIVVPLVVVSLIVLETATSVLEPNAVDTIAEAGRTVVRTTLGVDERTTTTLESALSSALTETIETATDVTLSQTIDIVSAAVDAVVGTVVFVFVLYYLLVDGPAAVDWVRRVVPLERQLVDELFTDVHAVVWAVFRSHLLVAVLQGVLGGLGLVVLGVPNAIVVAVALSLVAVLPTVGIWLVWGPVTVAHALSSGFLGSVALLGYGVGVLAVVDTYLRALFVDQRSGLHPAIALVGVVGGGVLFGIVGLFVGPVVLGAFVATVRVANRRIVSPSGRESADEGKRENPIAETER